MSKLSTQPIIYLLLPVILTISGCGTGRVTSSYDEFAGIKRDAIQFHSNVFGGTIYSPVGGDLWLRRITSDNGMTTYQVFGVIRAGSSFNTESIIFIINDSQKITLNGKSDLFDVNTSQYDVTYTENVFFNISPSQIRQLSEADSIRFRLYGDDTYGNPEEVSAGGRAAIKKFYDKFVIGRRCNMNKVGSRPMQWGKVDFKASFTKTGI